jgi:hypothetical protein
VLASLGLSELMNADFPKLCAVGSSPFKSSYLGGGAHAVCWYVLS